MSKLQLPDDDNDGMGPLTSWEWLMLLIVLCAFLLALSGCPAQGQDVLIPAYDAHVGEKALQLTPKGKERNLCLIINPNSGPGDTRDASYSRLIRGCNAKGTKVLFYIDLRAIPGDGLTPPSAKPHVKTPNELIAERTAYSRFYGSLRWDGWFFDDVAPTMADAFLCIASWPGVKVLNPGTAMTPPAILRDSAVIVISETLGSWPRALTGWEAAHRERCAVMGLGISAGSLPAFLSSTRGMAYRYASPLDDKWQHGQSAYSQLTPYFGRLFP